MFLPPAQLQGCGGKLFDKENKTAHIFGEVLRQFAIYMGDIFGDEFSRIFRELSHQVMQRELLLLKMDEFYVEMLFHEIIAHLSLMMSISPQVPIHLLWDSDPLSQLVPAELCGLKQWAPIGQGSADFFLTACLDINRQRDFLHGLSRSDVPPSSVLKKYLTKPSSSRSVTLVEEIKLSDKQKKPKRGARGKTGKKSSDTAATAAAGSTEGTAGDKKSKAQPAGAAKSASTDPGKVCIPQLKKIMGVPGATSGCPDANWTRS